MSPGRDIPPTYPPSAAINSNQSRICWGGGRTICREANVLHQDTRSVLVFVGFFFGFLVLIAVAGLGGWWFMKHIAPDPSLGHHHAALVSAAKL
jgi:hypothetical protein